MQKIKTLQEKQMVDKLKDIKPINVPQQSVNNETNMLEFTKMFNNSTIEFIEKSKKICEKLTENIRKNNEKIIFLKTLNKVKKFFILFYLYQNN